MQVPSTFIAGKPMFLSMVTKKIMLELAKPTKRDKGLKLKLSTRELSKYDALSENKNVRSSSLNLDSQNLSPLNQASQS